MAKFVVSNKDFQIHGEAIHDKTKAKMLTDLSKIDMDVRHIARLRLLSWLYM